MMVANFLRGGGQQVSGKVIIFREFERRLRILGAREQAVFRR